MRELPEPDGYYFREDSMYIGGGEDIKTGDYRTDTVLTIQKQAYEDGLMDALPAQPEEKHLLAILRVDNPALFREGLLGESDGSQTARMIESLIRKAEKQYAAILKTSQKESK